MGPRQLLLIQVSLSLTSCLLTKASVTSCAGTINSLAGKSKYLRPGRPETCLELHNFWFSWRQMSQTLSNAQLWSLMDSLFQRVEGWHCPFSMGRQLTWVRLNIYILHSYISISSRTEGDISFGNKSWAGPLFTVRSVPDRIHSKSSIVEGCWGSNSGRSITCEILPLLCYFSEPRIVSQWQRP